MRPSPSRPQMSGKCYDPVFLFMLVTMVLVIGSSFALRAVVSGMGPASARGSEMGGVDSQANGAAAQTPAAPAGMR